MSTDYENSSWEPILPGSHPEPDTVHWSDLDDKGHAFAEVVKYARSERYSHAWKNDAFILFRGSTTYRISVEAIQNDPVQAAFNLLQAIKG